MPKFGCSKFGLFGFVTFQRLFWKKYLTETRETLAFSFPLEVYLVKIVFELATKKHYFLNYLKCLKIMKFSYCIEVRSSDSEVRVRLEIFGKSSRCSKFGNAKVRVFEVRIFWVRSNTNCTLHWYRVPERFRGACSYLIEVTVIEDLLYCT